MAWSAGPVGSAATSTKTVTLSVNAGSLLIVCFACGDATGPSAISDTVNTWTPVTGSPILDATNGAAVAMWWAIAATTASLTVTITAGAAASNGTSIMEWTGQAASPADGGAGTANIAANTGANGMKTGSFTPSVDGDLLVMLINDDGNVDTVTQYNQGTGWTKVAGASKDPAGGSDTTYAVFYQIQGAHIAINPQCTEVASHVAVGMGGGFKVLVSAAVFIPRSGSLKQAVGRASSW